jgi:hypothetical protein
VCELSFGLPTHCLLARNGSTATVEPVTAAAATGAHPGSSGDRPFSEATPAEVRAALLPEEVATFEREWKAALAEAAETLDLTGVHRSLESWRRIAWSTQDDPAAHRRMLQAASKALAGERVSTVPASEIKALIRERLGL